MQADLLKKSRAHLQKRCKSMKISAQGSKGDIIERILNHLATNPDTIPPPTGNIPADRDASQRRSRVQLQRRMQYQPAIASRGGRRKTGNKSGVIKKRKSVGSKSKTTKSAKSTKSTKLQPKVSPKPQPLILQFIGIPFKYYQCTQPNIHYPLGMDSNVTSTVIITSLTRNSTICELKRLIHETCGIPKKCGLLILFSHVVISKNDTAKLRDFGITNHSLLIVAVIGSKRIKYGSQVDSNQHIRKSLLSTKRMIKKGTVTGLDIITQDIDADLYRMPVCGHLMSRESLYHYACSVFTDPSTVYLRCPHSVDQTTSKSKRWSCPQCTYLNPALYTNRCTKCGTERIQQMGRSNQCGAIWHYSLIKRILIHGQKELDAEDRKEDFDDFDFAKLEALSSRNMLQSGKALNVQKCGGCGTLHYQRKRPIRIIRRLEDYRRLKTKCKICDDHFCWNCGKVVDNDDHNCDGDYSSRMGIAQILAECPLKTIGRVADVPSIRACVNPDCCQLINHETACKHMKCGSCKVDFCFVCLKTKLGGEWQCGSYNAVCAVAPRQTLQTISMSRNQSNQQEQIVLKKSFQLF